MIRNLLVLLIFLGVGFGASVAQSDIFVRTIPKEETSKDGADKPKKKSIFLRPFARETKKNPASKNRYGSRLNTAGVERTLRDLRMLSYWRDSGRKPQGMKELQAYAMALRSENMAQMLQERDKILPGLIKAHKRRFDKLEAQLAMQAPNRKAVAEANEIIMAALKAKAEPAKAAEAVYKKYSTQTVKNASALREEEKPTTHRSVYKAKPIYRRQEDNNSSAASRVYKNYR